MIDLHMHTMYSDGDKTIAEILKLCEDKKLEYISITDHNTCAEYEDEYIKNNNIFCGKIIKGVEMNATFQNKKIEVLGYKIKEPKLIEEWSHKFFSEEVLREQQEESKRKLLDICDKKGLIYDENKIEKNIPDKKIEFFDYVGKKQYEDRKKEYKKYLEEFIYYFK